MQSPKRVRLGREESNHVIMAGDAMFNQLKYGGRHLRRSAIGLPRGHSHRRFIDLLFSYPTRREMRTAFLRAKVEWPRDVMGEFGWDDWMRKFKLACSVVHHRLIMKEDENSYAAPSI